MSNSKPLIDNTADLAAFLQSIADCPIIGVDTEFVRERTYHARLCLIQVSGNGHAACIDPLAIEDLSALAAILEDDQVVKIFHSARQDLEVLYQRFGFVVSPVFDTQIAAALIGHGEQVGYAAIVERLTGTVLPKGETRTDWSRRPLRDAQIEYALDDVLHLHEVHDQLAASLSEKERESWAVEEFATLDDPSLYFVDPADVWKRVKGLGGLKAPAQHQAARLAEWREKEALERDLPREWIIKDRSMIDIARENPTTPESLGQIQDVGKRTVDRYADQIFKLMAAPLSDDVGVLVESRGRPDKAENELRKRLMKVIKEKAESLELAASMLGNRQGVELLIHEPERSRLLSGWRRDVIGAELQAIVKEQPSAG